VIPGSLPKDIWFYLFRENAKNRGLKPAGDKDAQCVISAQQAPATVKALGGKYPFSAGEIT